MTATDPTIVLIVLAPLVGAYGTYVTMEAVATKSYVLGLVGSLLSLFAGLLLDMVVWGGIL